VESGEGNNWSAAAGTALRSPAFLVGCRNAVVRNLPQVNFMVFMVFMVLIVLRLKGAGKISGQTQPQGRTPPTSVHKTTATGGTQDLRIMLGSSNSRVHVLH